MSNKGISYIIIILSIRREEQKDINMRMKCNNGNKFEDFKYQTDF